MVKGTDLVILKSVKKALITGITGQDGSYMADLLISKGYKVFGLAKADSNQKFVPKEATVFYGNLGDHNSFKKALEQSVPDEIYNLAGISDLKTAYLDPDKTMEINYQSVGILINEALNINNNVRFLQASSSEIFVPVDIPLDEDSPRDFETKNPYAKAKMLADRDFIHKLREERNVFACSAILFTHDSPRRSEKGAMRRFIRTLVKIKLGIETCLSLGNIDMKRDWGFSGDYAEAMWMMLQIDHPEDLVIASGEIHSVKYIIDVASQLLDMKLIWHGEGINAFATDGFGNTIVRSVPEFYKPAEKYCKVGDISKAKSVIGFKPRVSFEKLIRMMVEFDLMELKK